MLDFGQPTQLGGDDDRCASPHFLEFTMSNALGVLSSRVWASLKRLFSSFGLCICLLSIACVVLNEATLFAVSKFNPGNLYFIYCVIGLALGFWRNRGGLYLFLFLISIVPNLHNQLAALLGASFFSLTNPGLDLAVGFVLGSQVLALYERKLNLRKIDMPWQIGLILTYLSVSTLLAIIRNLRQSASSTSLNGIAFNLINFRPYAWHDDFMPIADLIVYGIAGGVIASLLPYLIQRENRNQLIFRPIGLGLVATALMGCLQAWSGFGLPETYFDFRKDALGYVAIGFQPDIHAYAGHLMLGIVGLWGYIFSSKNSKEKNWFFLVVGISWLALILSKSRASLALSIVTSIFLLLAYIWREHKKYFVKVIWIFSGFAALIGLTLFFALQNPHLLSSNSWIGDLFNQYAKAGITGLSAATQNFGGRPEIYLAGLRMFSEFPILGLGQGGFFRQSADIEFSKSFMLSRWGGENAHNYFLQVLVENGLVGFLIFGLVLISPIILARSKKNLLPAVIALLALFLGNLFAHSFLVRENLILASIFVALMYAWQIANDVQRNENMFSTNPISSSRFLFVMLASLAIIIAGLWEAYHSFYRFPYQTGQRCFVSKPLFPDQWSSGILEIPLPANTRGLRVHIAAVGRPDLHRRPLQARIDVAYYEAYSHDHPPLATVYRTWEKPGPGAMEILLKDNAKLANGSGKAVLRLSNCFNPRDYGVSLDTRNLGVLIDRIEIF